MTSGVYASWGSFILREVRPTGKEIGRGAYGRVFEVNYEGTLCAAKEVHSVLLQYAQGDELQKVKDDFISECQIWSTIRHPCVVQFLGVYYPVLDQNRLPITVMEKMQHSLRSLVEKYDNIPFNVKLSILEEVCCGLRYLHSRNPPIIHRDLTPNNILLGGHLEAKITDLGVAKVVKSDNQKTMTVLPGTPDFMPPEALNKRSVYGPSLDVFSYGGVILNVTTQQWPEPTNLLELNPTSGRREIVSEVKRRQQYLDKMAENAADLRPLVISCLNDNPKNRPSVAQVLMTVKRIKEVCSHRSSHDRMSPIEWWAEQQPRVNDSLSTNLEQMTINNEQLRKEVDALKTDNAQLRINKDATMDEIGQLTVLLDKMADNNENQMQQINSHISEINAMRDENKQLRSELDVIKAENTELKMENNGLKTHVITSKLHNPQSLTGTRHKLKQQLVVKEPTLLGDLLSGPVNMKCEERAPAPESCYWHIAVLLNGLIYVGGGREGGGYASYTINCYDPINNLWNFVINTPACNFAMTTLNNKLLIAGGLDKDGKRSNQILKMDTGRLKKYTNMITARSSTTAAGHQGMLIITGGWGDNGKTLSSTELFDSSSGRWYHCNDLPQPHSCLQSVIIDNTLYLLGGANEDGSSSPAVFTALLNTLSKHQLKWNTHQDTPWCWSAPVTVNGTHLLIVGGNKKIKSEHIPTSNVYKLNKVSHSWEAIGNIPSARYSLATVSTADNSVIVIGGVNDKIKSTNTVWICSYEPQ